jgi:hypothetical protein
MVHRANITDSLVDVTVPGKPKSRARKLSRELAGIPRSSWFGMVPAGRVARFAAFRLAVDIRLATHCDPEAPSRRREHTDWTNHRLVIERSYTDPARPLTGPARGVRRLRKSGMSTSRRLTVRDSSAPLWATSSSFDVPNGLPAAISPLDGHIDRRKCPMRSKLDRCKGLPQIFPFTKCGLTSEGGQAGGQERPSAARGRSSVRSGDRPSRAGGSEVAGRHRARPDQPQPDLTQSYAE